MKKGWRFFHNRDRQNSHSTSRPTSNPLPFIPFHCGNTHSYCYRLDWHDTKTRSSYTFVVYPMNVNVLHPTLVNRLKCWLSFHELTTCGALNNTSYEWHWSSHHLGAHCISCTCVSSPFTKRTTWKKAVKSTGQGMTGLAMNMSLVSMQINAAKRTLQCTKPTETGEPEEITWRGLFQSPVDGLRWISL